MVITCNCRKYIEFALQLSSIIECKHWNHSPIKFTFLQIKPFYSKPTKFEADGTVKDVHKERFHRTRTTTSPASSAGMLQHFDRSPQKSVSQGSRDSGASRSSARRILKRAKWKVCIPRLLNEINEDDPERRMEYCEWFLFLISEVEEFAG